MPHVSTGHLPVIFFLFTLLIIGLRYIMSEMTGIWEIVVSLFFFNISIYHDCDFCLFKYKGLNMLEHQGHFVCVFNGQRV